MAPQSLITPKLLTSAYFFEMNARKNPTPGLNGKLRKTRFMFWKQLRMRRSLPRPLRSLSGVGFLSIEILNLKLLLQEQPSFVIRTKRLDRHTA